MKVFSQRCGAGGMGVRSCRFEVKKEILVNNIDPISDRNPEKQDDKERDMRFSSQSLVLLAAIFLFFFFFVATITPTSAQAQNAPADGATLFKSKCAMCHGPDGAGKTPMGQRLNIRDLRSPEVQKQSDAELSQVIAEGKGKMPAFKTLTADQVKLLVAHIRELAKK
jgi:mono/diheme cytochrome c family protein